MQNQTIYSERPITSPTNVGDIDSAVVSKNKELSEMLTEAHNGHYLFRVLTNQGRQPYLIQDGKRINNEIIRNNGTNQNHCVPSDFCIIQ